MADRWTPERGYGTAVTPRDTVEGLAERLREAQTVTLLEVRRRRHAERLARARAAELARVTAERDAAVADLDIERDSRDINRSLDAAAAVRAMYRESDACDALRAAVAAPVDTGWRDRAPMEAEVRAHRKAHPDDGGAGLWMVQPPGRMLQVWALYSGLGDEPGRWRPITAEGDPCAWPEVTP